MKIIKLQSALLVLMICSTIASPPHMNNECGNGYGQRPCVFLPAKPGATPKCATPGSTFCEHVADYPENLINKLLKNYKSRDILADEHKIDFHASKEITYNSPPYGHHFGPSNGNQHFNNNFNNFYHDNYNHRSPQVNGMPNKRNGYYYPRPEASSSHSFFQNKPPFSSSYADFYRRPTREIHPFQIFNQTDETQEAKEINFGNRFLNAISPFNRTRRQISADREQLCEVRSSYVNPQAALNVRGNWMYIVNGGETATQLVRTEVCASSECSNICQLPNGYNSRCEQKYVQKRLVTLDPRGERLFTDTFWFPSCCVCTLSNS